MTDTTTADDSYVQTVPDHCDRIVWRGRYHSLPLEAAKSPEAEELQIDHVDNATGETMCKVRFFIETPAGWVGAYHKAPLEYLLAARAPDSLSAVQKAWYEIGADVAGLDWARFVRAIDAARAKEGKA